MNDPGRVVIIGAGPTGLGAAWRLQELGARDYLVLEAKSGPGGLSASDVDPAGFTWDVGGHVQFSHYRYYDALLDRALGDAWLHHERESWVWIDGRFVPYPFQNNIHRLSPADRDRALAGLRRAAASRTGRSAENFKSWILETFGEELAELFLFPYNLKVWGYPLDSIGVQWMGDRVAVPDIARIQGNIERARDDLSWGPNRTFRFPERGGTGAIWNGVAALLDPRRLLYRARVVRVDSRARVVTLADGRQFPYDSLVSSVPLGAFCGICDGLEPRTQQAVGTLLHSSCHVLGIGLRGPEPETLRTKCWMYFPEPASPYYRVTVFSNYSPHNVPEGEGFWSLMAEVCETPRKPVDASRLREWCLDALAADRLLPPDSRVVSFWHRREEFGYPTPTVGRDEALSAVRTDLERRRIYSRGRFGAWKYEVSNQDHSCMQGVEVIDRLTGAGEEVTIDRPDVANSGVFLAPAAARSSTLTAPPSQNP